MKVKSLSRVRLLATPWTAAYQVPPSMGFSRQEGWSGVPLPSPPEGASNPERAHVSIWCLLPARHYLDFYWLFVKCIRIPYLLFMISFFLSIYHHLPKHLLMFSHWSVILMKAGNFICFVYCYIPSTLRTVTGRHLENIHGMTEFNSEYLWFLFCRILVTSVSWGGFEN